MLLQVPAPPDVSFLPSNFFAKNLLATLLLVSESDSEKIACENCDSGEYPETRCQQCSRYLCQFCTESHRRSRDTKTHTLNTLDELRKSEAPVIAETVCCEKHDGEIIKLYCKTCEETICRDCTIVEHRQHDYVFARDVSKEKKDELLLLVEEVKQNRSEMTECLEHLKKMEEVVQDSNESIIERINQYFEELESIAGNRKNGFLEEAAEVKNAKLKQLHLEQEKLELDLGSCNSSIEFTEQAFKNGNDVQILNLTKYMAQCLEGLKNKRSRSEFRLSREQEVANELTEHVNLCDRMAKFDFVEDRDETTDMYVASFCSTSEFLVVEKQCEIIIQPKVKRATQHTNRANKATISPSFEGVGVKAVVVVDNDDGSRIVRFHPIHTGELTFVAYINGSRVHNCCLTKTVKNNHMLPERCHIGDRILESGTHTWKIEIDHSDCFIIKPVDFEAGVIDCINSETSTFSGFVKNSSEATITFTLDTEEKELQINPSWSWRVQTLDVTRHRRVFPYFSSDCDECKITFTNSDGWRFVQYKNGNF